MRREDQKGVQNASKGTGYDCSRCSKNYGKKVKNTLFFDSQEDDIH